MTDSLPSLRASNASAALTFAASGTHADHCPGGPCGKCGAHDCDPDRAVCDDCLPTCSQCSDPVEVWDGKPEETCRKHWTNDVIDREESEEA